MSARPEVEFAGTERFEVRRRLGAGAMGVVYEAFDRQRGTAVALKLLLRGNARALMYFKNEFRALQRIEHPNLVGLGELFTEGGQWFFTMELVEGVDLLRYVRDDPEAVPDELLVTLPAGATACFDEARLRACLAQLARALAALHAAGVVHRDVKPSNILVTREGRLVLLDFGLALEIGRRDLDSADLGIVGTAAYMAPEQAEGGQVGPASDWYSFGTVLYEALTGRLPHGGANPLAILMNKQRHVPPPPRACNPTAPRDLDRLCEELLLGEPGERPTGPQIHERLGFVAATAPVRTSSMDFTQTIPFVGRDAELARLEAGFAAMRETGTTRILYVEGASGMGKSTLLQEATDRIAARVADVVVLDGRCYENELVPYKAFDGVVDSLSRWLARLPVREAGACLPRYATILTRVFPALERVEVFMRAPAIPMLGDPHELRARAFAALRELLARLSDRWPLVVVIDDMQWADADSLLLLADLLAPPEPPRMLLLVGARPEEVAFPADGKPLRGRLLAALGATPVEHVTLAPLTLAAGTELACLMLSQQHGTTAAAAAIATEAAGHPFFIAELCRHHAQARPAHDHVVMLDEAIATRVATLPEDTRRILALVCVAEAPLPRAILASAADIEPTALARQVMRLRIAYLVRTGAAAGPDTVAPYHARVIEAVVGHLDDAALRDAHQRIASAFESSNVARESPERLVRHLEAAGDRASAARHAEIAARRASEALAFDRAAELYRAAIRLGEPVGDARRALSMALAQTLVRAGRGPEAATAFLAAAEDADPATRLACRRQAAEQLIITGHVDRGLETLGELLVDIGEPLARTPRRALASLLWNRVRLRVRGLRFRERHETEIAPSELMRGDILRVVGLGLAMIDTIRGADFNARFLLAALRSGELSRVVPALGAEASYLASQSERSRRRARAIHGQLHAIAERTGDPYHRAWVDGLAGITAFFAGRFGIAAELSARSLATFRDHVIGTTWEQNNFRMFQMFGLRFQGDFEAVRALMIESVADATRRGDRYLETTARFHMTLAWLAADDIAGAQANLALASWSPPAGGLHLQHWYELEAKCEVAIYGGRAAAVLDEVGPVFDALDRSLLLRIQLVRCVSRWVHMRLLLAAADGPQLAASTRAQVARICHRLEGEPNLDFAAVYARLGRAALASAVGGRDEALRHLRTAVTLADACDMRPQAAAARWRLGEILGGDEGAALVAEAEAALRRDGTVRPERMVALVAPGFASATRQLAAGASGIGAAGGGGGGGG